MTEVLAKQAAAAADRYFHEGFNCAQAVLRAVAEARGQECPQCIPAIALAMGGGVGHTGCVCGAATGGVMAIGLATDRAVTGPQREKKEEAHKVAGRFIRQFAAEFGSPDCREILGFDWSEKNAMDRFRKEGAMDAKCTPCVRWAAAEATRVVGDILDGRTP